MDQCTSKYRHTDGSDITPETVKFDFDTDLHSHTMVVVVYGGRKTVDTYTVDALSLSTPTTLTGENSTLTLSSTFLVEHGLDLSSTTPLFPLSYVLLFLCWLLPQHFPIPYQINLLTTTACIIYIGSHLSLQLRVKDTNENGDLIKGDSEVMSTSDAMRFPFVGSAALFSLYLSFKYLDPEWVNFVISLYFTIAGAFAVASSFSPVVDSVLPKSLKMEKKIKFNHPLPKFVMESPFVDTITTADVLSGLGGLAVGYMYMAEKHWTVSNILGISFCLTGISLFSIGTFRIAAILLIGLFFYDVFWVFGTPVMVTVAKKLDGPIKLLFPRSLEKNEEGKINLSLLGLGDIVIPGFLISFMLRFDASLSRLPNTYNPTLSFPKPYFHSILVSYVLGLGLTLYMMTKFKAAQPALLYLVPATLCSVMGTAFVRGEVKELLGYSEEEEVVENGEENKVADRGKMTPVKSKRA